MTNNEEAKWTIIVDNKKYTVISDAYNACWPDNRRPQYEALAICEDDECSESGYKPCYRLRWDVLDQYVRFDADELKWSWTEAAVDRDEYEYCNWYEPSSIEGRGWYSDKSGAVI